MSALLVYESMPLNAGILAGLANLELRELRSFAQLEQAVSEADPLVVAIEVQLNHLARAMESIYRTKSRTNAAVIAMPNRAAEPWTRYLYEAGADLVFRSMLDRAKAAALMDNRVRVHRESCQNQVDLPLESQIWKSLPWKRHASGGSS